MGSETELEKSYGLDCASSRCKEGYQRRDSEEVELKECPLVHWRAEVLEREM